MPQLNKESLKNVQKKKTMLEKIRSYDQSNADEKEN